MWERGSDVFMPIAGKRFSERSGNLEAAPTVQDTQIQKCTETKFEIERHLGCSPLMQLTQYIRASKDKQSLLLKLIIELGVISGCTEFPHMTVNKGGEMGPSCN